MGYLPLTVIGLAIFFYSISVRQLERAEVTGPMLFVTLGVMLASFFGDDIRLEWSLSAPLPLVELTLAVFLFSDAAKARLTVLSKSFQYPSLLLFIALPLSFVLGTWLAHWLFPALDWLACAILAIILTPTDAALSKGILVNEQVPESVREGINSESGLNDGLCVPVFLFLLLLPDGGNDIRFVDAFEIFIREIGIALVLAVLFSAAGIYLLTLAQRRHLFSRTSSPFLILGMAMSLFSLTQYFHGSGFIAVFLAGLIFDRFYQSRIKEDLIQESETVADFIALLIWALFGYVAYTEIVGVIDLPTLLYALLSATFIRILPVLLSLSFTRLNWHERFTFAWFGPRGLASIVFTMMVLQTDMPYKTEIAQVALTTILLSVFLHGVTARPLAMSFKRKPDAEGKIEGE